MLLSLNTCNLPRIISMLKVTEAFVSHELHENERMMALNRILSIEFLYS